MGWEERNGRIYYYRKRRQGTRVVSEYVGAGLAGQMAELFDLEDKEETQFKRAELKNQKASADAIDSQVSQVEHYIQAIMRGCLLLAGYHVHKRQWRKIRNV